MKHFYKIIRCSRTFFAFIGMMLALPQVNAQTQGITDSVHIKTGVPHGYYYSLPVDYAANPTKKYPLLIALHGKGEKGNGSTELYKVLQGGGTTIADRLNANSFPAYFDVDGETFSFIVVCPQYYTGWSSKSFLQYIKANFRVDPERIYITGLSEGGDKSWSTASSSWTGHAGPDSLAAVFLICPSINQDTAVTVGHYPINVANRSNLPVFCAYNKDDDEFPSMQKRTDSLVNSLNLTVPSVSPPARKAVYVGSDHEGWTKSYNPANIIDSVGWTNMYKWFLQFRNKNLVAKAGKDTIITLPASVVTLNGSRSTARRGRIASYLWSKVSGPATYTIASSSSAVTNVSDLVAGTYQFELRLTHDTAGVTARDTITVTVNPDTTVQTQTKVGQNVSTNIKGYLLSLPVNYATDSTKKFPLIISLHGADAIGDSSTGAPLDSVATKGIPKLIRDGQFPNNFNVDGKNYSFIVVSPQINSLTPSFIHNQLNILLNYLKSTFRVDVERVYVAGLGKGSGFGYTFLTGGTTTPNVGFVDSIAAMIGAGSDIPAINATQLGRLVQSNLPHWLTHNNADPVIASSKSSNAVSNYNAGTPVPLPLARIRLFASSVQDSWTTTYDPNYVLDSATGYNVYKWLLQYTNKRLVATAGKDITIPFPDTDTVLDGTKSVARNGRVNSYTWTKISGGSATIASSTSAVTAISGLSGTYQFELAVTHDSLPGSVKDTITVTVNGSSPRIAAPAVNLAPGAETTDEILRARISPTVAQSQITIIIDGKAKGKANLQLTGMDGKRLQLQSFVKDGAMITRSMNVGSLPSGTYIVEVIVAGKYRKVLRFIRQ